MWWVHRVYLWTAVHGNGRSWFQSNLLNTLLIVCSILNGLAKSQLPAPNLSAEVGWASKGTLASGRVQSRSSGRQHSSQRVSTWGYCACISGIDLRWKQLLEVRWSWQQRPESSVQPYADRQAREMKSFTFSPIDGIGKDNEKLILPGNRSVNTHLLSMLYVSDIMLCKYRAWLLFSRMLWSIREDRMCLIWIFIIIYNKVARTSESSQKDNILEGNKLNI